MAYCLYLMFLTIKFLIMKKKKLTSLKLNKMVISKANSSKVKGGYSVQSDCLSHCLGYECPDHK